MGGGHSARRGASGNGDTCSFGSIARLSRHFAFFKDESAHATGSLKHRLAHSLLLASICDGSVTQGVPLIDASSGSTAVSEAYYAQLLGLDFYAVVPRGLSLSKQKAILQYGGRLKFVEHASSIYPAAKTLAQDIGGHFLDQFTNAERAIDWRRNNIAESIFQQMQDEPAIAWIVMGAGTGGTASTIGRHIRYSGRATRLCVPDVEYSAFYDGWASGDRSATCEAGSRIEGVGRPRVEPSFLPDVVDAMVKIPDAASIAACRFVSDHLGRRVGGSTGANFLGAIWAADQMRKTGQSGSIVTLICDDGDRYADTYFCDDWLNTNDLIIAHFLPMVEAAFGGKMLHPDMFLRQSVRKE
ncbi:pyridoxal-phosphate dependent enzyme [Devosia sp. YIM 151766]|uniref:PLP-dependent cysteine synthase family protein n=1 Tax=Devosia sp. YIM 151766 TaxID=3017325 RepID=UPI00255CA9E5|nr:pyridoxal-phosphate dependent enzyme [Devosia sp. YIM 151766]WIY54544.1 pyridoxal-phosphate dependent enzyme [Devosia sp. YIM 151766]